MVSRALRFNTYLLLLAGVVIFAGCQSVESRRKKALTVFGIHLEAKPDPGNRTGPVTVLRDNPINLIVEKSPFLNEGMVKDAALVESSDGGFSLAIQFDQRGTWLLEQYTSRNSGKHIAVSAKFGPKLETFRWLAAPIISRRIADGVLGFTPDADREETMQIVTGLKNVAKESQPKGESPAK